MKDEMIIPVHPSSIIFHCSNGRHFGTFSVGRAFQPDDRTTAIACQAGKPDLQQKLYTQGLVA